MSETEKIIIRSHRNHLLLDASKIVIITVVTIILALLIDILNIYFFYGTGITDDDINIEKKKLTKRLQLNLILFVIMLIVASLAITHYYKGYDIRKQ